jgi:hypothetical protein
LHGFVVAVVLLCFCLLDQCCDPGISPLRHLISDLQPTMTPLSTNTAHHASTSRLLPPTQKDPTFSFPGHTFQDTSVPRPVISTSWVPKLYLLTHGFRRGIWLLRARRDGHLQQALEATWGPGSAGTPLRGAAAPRRATLRGRGQCQGEATAPRAFVCHGPFVKEGRMC